MLLLRLAAAAVPVEAVAAGVLLAIPCTSAGPTVDGAWSCTAKMATASQLRTYVRKLCCKIYVKMVVEFFLWQNL